MKAAPTLEGGLRIDAEEEDDWEILRSVIADANGGTVDLASRLGNFIDDEAGGEDWEEYVVPDLREGFQDELGQVAASIESAVAAANGGTGPLWITRQDGFAWYSAFNQARLALEELYHFGPAENIKPTRFNAEKRAAFLRSKFYCAIQSLLLEYVMG